MNVYLIGYRGSGKTTVGRLLGERLQLPVVDTDAIIEAAAEQTIAEIFAAEQEAGFRDRETDAIKQVAGGAPVVASLGGGAILRPENRALIQQSGQAVWLDASAEVLWDRINNDAATAASRPALTSFAGLAEVKAVLAERRPLYEEVANLVVDASGAPADIAEFIASSIASRRNPEND